MKSSDTASGYGWISIALHWLTAAIVLTLWYTGSMSQALDPERHTQLVRTHTTVALSVWLLLWARLIWRFMVGHPGAHPGQRSHLFGVGKYMHYLLLLAVGVMLISGPLMVWAGGGEIEFFQAAIPSPFASSAQLHGVLREIHAATGTFIILVTVLHIMAVIFHAAILRDGTFEKIMIADGGRMGEKERRH